METQHMNALELDQVTKSFGGVEVLRGVDLRVAKGEFVVIVGPSGCGKSTLLRIIAGLDEHTSGHLRIGGELMDAVPPSKRGIAMVFQSYALYPHLSVADNMSLALKREGVHKDEIRRRIDAAAAMLKLEPLLQRRPAQLSGGQRQRVALARALVNRPRLLLLDEPLGALDLKLREEMQIELKAIQAEVGITFVYVTHDQEEALTMSNRLAVFHDGRIEQIGAPADVYEHPATTFVAGFVGTSNLLIGDAARAVIGSDGVYTVRPEKIRLADPAAEPAGDEGSAVGRIGEVVYIGPETRYIVELEIGGQLVVTQQNLETSSMEALETQGRPVRLIWKRRHVLSLAKSEGVEGETEEETSR